MLGDDQIAVDRRPDVLDQRGLEHVEDPTRECHQEIVARGDRDRAVKARVGEAELVAGGISPGRVFDRRRQRLDRRLVGALGRQPRERDLEEHPRLEQFAQRDALRLEHRRDRLAHVPPDALVWRVLDEHPAGTPLLHADQMGSGQPPQPLSERRPADPEFPRQFVLGSDSIARLEPRALDVHPDLVGDLLARVGVHNLEPTGLPCARRSRHASSVRRRRQAPPTSSNADGAVRPPIRARG